MNLFKMISALHVAVFLTVTASAQMRLIPSEQVNAVSYPRLSADSASVAFDRLHIVADPMTEDDAPKTFIYKLTNVGQETLTIRRLVSTCSCASAFCPVKEVVPGASAEITVKYYPKGHPGHFERRVFVYTQQGNDPVAVLRLTVDVAGGSDKSVEWPVRMGAIRLRCKDVTFAEGRKSVENISFINLTGKTLKLECESAFLPECLSFSAEPVPPGAEGQMKIAYDPSRPGARRSMKLILKGLDIPPSQASITVTLR